MSNGKLKFIEDGLFNHELKPEYVIEEYGSRYKLPFIFGTEERDNITGTKSVDWIYAGDGNDTIHAGDGDDLVVGENGDDTIYGGAGNDRIDGVLDKDYIDGGEGDDFIIGGSDEDILIGGDGDDIIYGDYVHASGDGEADDILIGGAGNDQLFGGGGNDYIAGNEGEDIIQGGTGDDVLWGEGYEDPELPPYMREADIFVYTEYKWGNDTIMDFDDGLDLIDFSGHPDISGMSDFTVAQSGADTVISYDYVSSGPFNPGTYTSTITLAGIAATDIDQADFIF